MIEAAKRIACLHDRMARSPLLALFYEVDSGRSQGLAYQFGLVSDDRKDVLRRHDSGRSRYNVPQQGLACDSVQHFGMARFQSSAFSGSKDGDGELTRLLGRHDLQEYQEMLRRL